MYLAGFFFDVDSPPEACAALLCWELVVTVDVEEDESDDATDEEEFVRWTLLRGISMRETSSGLGEASEDWSLWLEGYHPRRDTDCTLGGAATAVMSREGRQSWRGSRKENKSAG
jgi:hypothetical protein